jgi:hypothetical protein
MALLLQELPAQAVVVAEVVEDVAVVQPLRRDSISRWMAPNLPVPCSKAVPIFRSRKAQ